MIRILIIDDSLVMRNLLQEFLIDEGFDVSITGNPIEGIRMAIEEEWSVVICDTHMPEKNGYEVYSEVTAKKPDLPFLITDSLPDDLPMVPGRIEGNYHYLKKPFELDQIRQILKSCLWTAKTDQ